MSLSFRPAHATDLPRCLALLAPLVPLVYEPDVWAALPALWARLLAERRLAIHVFEDSARPTAHQLFLMASGVFITPDFAATLMADPIGTWSAPGSMASTLAVDRAGCG